MAQKAPARKRPSSSSAPGRRKSCHFCKDKITEVDYKNVNQLRRYISEKARSATAASRARAAAIAAGRRRGRGPARSRPALRRELEI
jgi:small subunit ribosomal protein S18